MFPTITMSLSHRWLKNKNKVSTKCIDMLFIIIYIKSNEIMFLHYSNIYQKIFKLCNNIAISKELDK